MQNPTYTWEPMNDGVDHINIYTKANTALGKWMSNLSFSPFTHPDFGSFLCVEGAWHWFFTGCQYNEFRFKSGFEARKLADLYKKDKVNLDRELTAFEKMIIQQFIHTKFETYSSKLEEFKQSELPFAHYYYYGDKLKPKVHYLPQYDWLVKFFERYRARLNGKY